MASIQLLHQFNGYTPGFHDFGAVENARLVALGLARSWTVEADGGQSFDDTLTSTEVAATRALVSGARISSDRFCLASFGDSINSQDLPAAVAAGGTVSDAGSAGVSPLLWTNALCAGAFDYGLPLVTALMMDNGSGAISRNVANGIVGFSGGLVRQALKNSIDAYIPILNTHTGGRRAVVMLSGGINDISNTDTAGYGDLVWADLLTVIDKLVAAGHVPLLKCNEASVNINTATKRKNARRLADLVLSYAAANRTTVRAIDCGALLREFSGGQSLERLTRGSTGDEVHPNANLAAIYGIGYARALSDAFIMCPPWERADFSGTSIHSNPYLTGTTGTKGTNCNVAAEVPTGFTLNSFGTNTTVNCTQEAAYDGPGSGVLVDASCTGAPTQDSVALSTNSNPTTVAGVTYRAWVDMTIIQADYVRQFTPQLRSSASGSPQRAFPSTGSTDTRDMTADTPNAPKLMEKRRIVFSSFPEVWEAAAQGGISGIGCYGLTSASSRFRAFIRFAGVFAE